jgi:citrate synthase
MTDAPNPGTARLTVPGGGTVELPVLSGTVGPDVIDIRKLHAQTGMFTYDPGFTSTASCRSAVTYIDGDEGVLQHRGYSIQDLAANSSFLEVAYLILHGELPTAAEHDRFVRGVTYHSMVNEQVRALFAGFRRDAHPMAVMVGVVGALSAFYHEDLDTADPAPPHDRDPPPDRQAPDGRGHGLQVLGRPALRVPAQRPGYAENFLHMMFAVPCEPYEPAPVLAQGARPRSSSCTPTTSRTPRPRPCGWSAPRAPAPTRRSPPASPRCGGRPTAAPTRPWSGCWRRSAARTASPSSSPGPRTRARAPG